jgi:hypothetical protein
MTLAFGFDGGAQMTDPMDDPDYDTSAAPSAPASKPVPSHSAAPMQSEAASQIATSALVPTPL